jgi:Icc-related predicted phosphoesterase
VCGHIHESWGERSRIGDTEVANLGPDGAFFDVE